MRPVALVFLAIITLAALACTGGQPTSVPISTPTTAPTVEATVMVATEARVTSEAHKTKDTKNKVVYGTKDGAVIQSVYIDKDALGDVPPATLQVVISPQEA